MNWYFQVLSRYAEFNGRARRSEYWYFALVNFFISLFIYAVDFGIGAFGVLGLIYSLFVLIPGLAVLVRRLHDTGRSGWTILLALIPLVGAVILLVFTFEDSEDGENIFGHSPKYNQE
jgi:uncharacterized membrane protein YhaH (DUF805 family)